MARSHRNRTRRGHRRQGRRSAALAFVVVGVVVALAGLSAVGYVVSIAMSAPPLRALEPRDLGGASRVYSADGTALGFVQAQEFREVINGDKIPQVLKQATVAIEDERFYEHEGVDPVGVIRAAIANARSGETVQGGSTLTMQLVRALYISNEQTYTRKIREAKLAEELENERSKEWILEAYLNSVPYGTIGGQEARGVQAAAKMYFNKSASKLELHEAAMIAGLPQAPTSYSPVRFPERALARRNEVINKMAELGMITASEANAALEKDLGVDRSTYYTRRRESYFFDYVRKELEKEYGRERVRKGGLKVYTTLDLSKQKAARDTLKERMAVLPGPASAIVTLDHKGQIEAMASTATYKSSVFNLVAQGKRQPGSTFKIMALMAAVREGANPDTVTYHSSSPYRFPVDVCTDGEEAWELKTYSGSGGGTMDLVEATRQSDNVVYAKLTADLGVEKVKEAAHDMGIKAKLDKEGCSLSLGGLDQGVSPLEMAVAYTTIANGGYRTRPTAIRKVVLPSGKSERPKRFRPKRTRAFEAWVTHEVTKALQKNMTDGTGQSAQIGCPTAGKTGTTDKSVDAWFVGFTPKLTTAVWIGYPEGQKQIFYNGTGLTGSALPAPIWGDYMKKITGKKCGKFKKPKTDPEFRPWTGRFVGSTGSGASPSPTPGVGGFTPGPAPAPAPDTSTPQSPPPPAPAPEAPAPPPAPAPPAPPPNAPPAAPPATALAPGA